MAFWLQNAVELNRFAMVGYHRDFDAVLKLIGQAPRSFQPPIATASAGGSVQRGLLIADQQLCSRPASSQRSINAIRCLFIVAEVVEVSLQDGKLR